MVRVVVLGGGLAGLAAAHRVLELAPEVEVQVLEASDRPGGLIHTEEWREFVIDRGPDSILVEKPPALRLAKRLGLEGDVVRTRSGPKGAYVVHRGRLRRVPEGFSVVAPGDLASLFRSTVLSKRGTLRASLEPFLPRGKARGDESLAHFVTRRFGREVFDALAQPLAGGIYGADPSELSLRATMPRFLEMEERDRSVTLALAKRMRASRGEAAAGARYGMFVSFRRGMGQLTESLAAALGERVKTQRAVAAIEREGGGYRIRLRKGQAIRADGVVVALPAPVAGPLVGGLDEELGRLMRGIRYGSAAIVSLAYRREEIPHPLDAYGFVVPAAERRGILASTFSSIKWPHRAPEGYVLLRAFLGGHARPDLPRASDAVLVGTARRELRELMGIAAEPLVVRVDRATDAMPRYRVGHLELVDRIEAGMSRLPRLAVAGGAYRGVGIPDTVASAERAAASVLSEMQVDVREDAQL